MNFLFDIGHPAHVHYFKHTIRRLKDEGHMVMITARDRYPVFELLSAEGFEFINRGKGRSGIIGKLLYLLHADLLLFRLGRRNQIDCFVGFGNPYIAHAAWLNRSKSLVVDDTDNAQLNHRLYVPFASSIVSPNMFTHDFGVKHRKFNGYMELSYLNNEVFKVDDKFFEENGMAENESYVLIRFVSWNANHDFGHTGMSFDKKLEVVNRLSKFAKVLISSEDDLPDQLKQYAIQINPEDMHRWISHALLLFGESATMASEAACLGVPAIYIDNEGRSYTDELDRKYGIVFNFSESISDQEKAIRKAESIVSNAQRDYFREIGETIQNEKESFDVVLMEELFSLISVNGLD